MGHYKEENDEQYEKKSPVNMDAEETGLEAKTVSAKGTLIAGLLAGITASACCAGPLVLLMLGVSGGWISNFSALEPYRPIFIGIAGIFLWLAYRKIYRKPQVCSTDAACATQQGQRTQRILFWVIAIVIALSISFPWYGPVLFD